jgi:hypothetical protein
MESIESPGSMKSDSSYINHVLQKFPIDDIEPLHKKKFKTCRSILRKKLLKTANRCVISNIANLTECDCAHIIPRSEGSEIDFPDTDKVSNFLLLSNNLHSLFDNMVWTIDIYHIMDHEPKSQRYFEAKIISRPIKSSIDQYDIIKLPVDKYASMMLHYYSFHYYHYNNEKKCFHKAWSEKKELYHLLKQCNTTNDIIELISNIRHETEDIENQLYPFTAIIDENTFLWDYYSYIFITIEHDSYIVTTVT